MFLVERERRSDEADTLWDDSFTYYWHEDHKKYMEYAGIEPYVGPNDKNATRVSCPSAPCSAVARC